MIDDIWNKTEILNYLWDIRYIILVYFIGDIITTLYALRLGGTEGNILIRTIINKFGALGFITVKTIPMVLLYIFNYGDTDATFWTITKWFIVAIYICANVHNIQVIRELRQNNKTQQTA